jgi:hypothetical protein
MNFVYKKISKTTFHLINNEQIIINILNTYIPFGLDNKSEKYIINFSINNKTKEGIEVINIIEEIEKYFQSLDFIIDTNDEKLLLSNKQFVSSIKQNKNFYPLLKTYIKKNNNNIITNIIKKKSLGTIYDIQPKIKCDTIINLGSLWYNENSYGLLWFIKEININ